MSNPPSSDPFHSLLHEARVFESPPAFVAGAEVRTLAEHRALCERAHDDPEGFWTEEAERLDWMRPWDTFFEKESPQVRFFVGGQLNLAANCLDRHLDTHGDKPALVWIGEPTEGGTERRVLTYRQLHAEVCRAANALTALGVGHGDRVAVYLPMIPELAITLLACARIGATHSVIFGGFSAEAIRDRVRDAGAKLIVTADGGWRRGKVIPLWDNVDRALDHTQGRVDGCVTVEKVLVVERIGHGAKLKPGRDVLWSELVPQQSAEHQAPPIDSEHPLFILYTSGTTGKPKGVMHTTGGYSVGVSYTPRLVFDLRDDDVYWCTADVGWVTGHSYVIYGPLLNAATTVMYEGAPDAPDKDRLWRIIADEKVTIFYTAPTAIRTFMRWGSELPDRHNLTSLRLLGTVGEPINPEAWMWYRKHIGGDRCPVVDTWWQTETGAIMIAPLPGAVPQKPGSCTLPLPGIDAAVVGRDGRPCPPNAGGFLVVRRPWPSIFRTIWGDRERYIKTYFSEIHDPDTHAPYYFAGDGARCDEDGYFWVMGRVDDVINVAGHRLGTMEIESALVGHPHVAEAAVVGRPDELKGQAIVAFVTLRGAHRASAEMHRELVDHVVREIGALARPEEIRFTDALPKTRSGKIMRRLLREIAAGVEIRGDVTTLEDFQVLQRLSAVPEEE